MYFYGVMAMSHRRKNWSRVEKWFPSEVCYPSSLGELRKEILSAKAKGAKIRAAGSLHSYNDLCVTKDVQIHTDKLNKILSIDKSKMLVRVEGGIKIKKLLDALAKEGLTLPNQGYIQRQSIAGSIATATHGSGKTGTLSSFVEEIELVDAQGDLRVLNPQTNEHLFSAALVNLGCLGIVYALTLRCIPLYKLHLTKVKSTLTKTLKELPDILNQYDHVHLYIDPYSQDVLIWRCQQTEEQQHHIAWHRLQRLIIKTLAVSTYQYLPTPNLIFPLIPKIFINVSANFSCVDHSHKLLSPADEGIYVEEEIAIPIEHVDHAVQDARDLIHQFGRKYPLMVGVIVVRFTEADSKGYLSPALNRRSAYITFCTIVKKGYQCLFKEFETAMLKYTGRPHWGKIHTLTKEKLAILYGDNYAKFQDARRELDPEGLFSNDYINRLF